MGRHIPNHTISAVLSVGDKVSKVLRNSPKTSMALLQEHQA